MTPANWTVEVYRGEDKKLSLTLKNKSTGTPIDITGYTISFVVAVKNSDGTYGAPVLTLDNDVNGGVTITNATAGQFEVLISDTQTSGLSAGDYVYILKTTDGTGLDDYPLMGVFRVYNAPGA